MNIIKSYIFFSVVTTSGGGGGGTWGSITGTLSNQTDLQAALDLKADKYIEFTTPDLSATTDYTLVITDADVKQVRMNKATACNLNIPTNASVPFPIGTQILIKQIGNGLLTFVPALGVTVTSSSTTLVSPGKNALMALVKTGTDTWDLDNGVDGSAYGQVNSVVAGTNITVDNTDPQNPIVSGANFTGLDGLSVSIAIHADVTASIAMNNQASTEQPVGNTARAYPYFDATKFSKVRVTAIVATGSASPNSPRIYPQYSTDGGTNFITVGTGALPEAASLVNAVRVKSDWITIPVGAKADVVWRVAQNGGDGVADPSLANVYMEFRV